MTIYAPNPDSVPDGVTVPIHVTVNPPVDGVNLVVVVGAFGKTIACGAGGSCDATWWSDNEGTFPFSVQLFDGRGERIPTERLSAGERQLLAVAMLWGLARVSGRRLPMVIDTPLGRLDSKHRSHIVERYFPHASHQVILLSTDEEIDQSLFASLEPWIGRSYELRHDDMAGCTQIVEGYFWEEVSDVA